MKKFLSWLGVHFHDWHYIGVWNNPNYCFSYFMMRCRTCEKLQTEEHRGHWSLPKDKDDPELAELKKLVKL